MNKTYWILPNLTKSECFEFISYLCDGMSDLTARMTSFPPLARMFCCN